MAQKKNNKAVICSGRIPVPQRLTTIIKSAAVFDSLGESDAGGNSSKINPSAIDKIKISNLKLMFCFINMCQKEIPLSHARAGGHAVIPALTDLAWNPAFEAVS